MSKSVKKDKDRINSLLINIKKAMIKGGAGQAVVRFKNSGVIDGWNFAVVVQEPGYDGDDAIDFENMD